ncbi:MAG TPA: PA14 domain-containing protein [Bacteroidota bacterium]|nr:PA14 domain-containing protein [Bacteroidota bacterium]
MLEVTGNLDVTDKTVQVKNAKPGLTYSLYKGSWSKLPDFKTLTPVKEGVTPRLAIPDGISGDDFGLAIGGYIKIDKAAMYTFALTSDDGSQLFIDDEQVITNDGLHGMKEQMNAIYLHKGFHSIRCEFFQGGGGAGLVLKIAGGGMKQQTLPESMLWHKE